MHFLVAASAFAVPPASQPDTPLPVRFSAVLPLTGKLAPYGLSARRGLELAVRQVNEQGGISGQPIELIFMDDGSSDRNVARLVTRAVIADGSEAILGGLAGTTALALRPAVERQNVPLLVLAGGYRSLTEGHRLAFRLGAADSLRADALARFVRKSLSAGRLYVLSAAGDDAAALSADRVAAAFRALDGQVVGIESCKAGDDLFALAARMSGARADAFYAALPAARLVALAEAVRKTPLGQAPLVGDLSDPPDPALLAEAAAVLRPAYFAAEFLADDPAPAVRRFVADFARSRSDDARPDAAAAVGHDAILVLADALRRRAAAGMSLRDAISTARIDSAVLGPLGFDAEGRAVKPVLIARLAPQAGEGAVGQRLVFVARIEPAEADNKPAPPANAPAPPQGNPK